MLIALAAMFLQQTFASVGKVLPAVLAPLVIAELHADPAWVGVELGDTRGASTAGSTLPTDAKVCCRNIAARAIDIRDKTAVSLNYLAATAGEQSKPRTAPRGPDETFPIGTRGAPWHITPPSPAPSRAGKRRRRRVP